MNFRHKLFLNIGITLGAIFLCSAVILFLGGKIQKQVADLNRVRTDEALRVSLLTYLGSLKANQEKVRPYLPVVQNLLPTASGSITLPETLRVLAMRHSLEGFSFSFGSEKEATASEPGTIGFTSSVVGSSSNLLNFLKSFETLDTYVLRVNTFDLTFRDRTNDYNLSIVGNIYIR